MINEDWPICYQSIKSTYWIIINTMIRISPCTWLSFDVPTAREFGSTTGMPSSIPIARNAIKWSGLPVQGIMGEITREYVV